MSPGGKIPRSDGAWKIEHGRVCGTGKLARFLKILFASCLESRIKCYTSICGLSHPLVLMVRERFEGLTSMFDGRVARRPAGSFRRLSRGQGLLLWTAAIPSVALRAETVSFH
jgi:hypothetical protein